MGELGDGIGLQYGVLKLTPVQPTWLEIGSTLASHVATALGSLAVEVEHIGSTSVPGLLAKPIIDLAIGLPDGSQDIRAAEAALTTAGWIYRGDAGDEGGHVFVLEERPWIRVAHAHAVEHAGLQWTRYKQFRDLLRSDPRARTVYSNAKSELLSEHGADGSRARYTEQKAPVVGALLSQPDF